MHKALPTKVFELELLLRDHNIHVACIQETYLNDKSKIYLENYQIYRNDRVTHGGGVAIAIKQNIKHKLLGTNDTTTIENISVSIDVSGRELIITSVYNTPIQSLY